MKPKLPNPFFGILPNTTSLGGTPTVPASDLLRPFPIYRGGVTNNLVQVGHYRSDALQASLQQRALGDGRGAGGVVTWNISYTFAKTYEQNHRLQNWNTAEPLIYEIDFQDKPHNFSAHGVWDLPIGKNRRFLNKRGVVDALVGNWRFSGLFTWVSGYPVGWPNLINRCASWQVEEQTEDRWFNNDKTCYTQFPTNSLRTLPDRFSDIRQHQAPQVNAALEKTFSITERYRLQFRGEAFNLTNTPIRGNPDTGFTSQTFGQLPKSQLNFPRFFQLAAKLYF